jgi:hypothetical protein
MPTVLAKNLDTTKITIAEPKPLKSGAKQAYVNYSGEKLTLQSAKEMRTPFGFNVWGEGTAKKYSINLSFDGMETNPGTKDFYDAMKRLDEYMIDLGVANARAWFKKDMSRELIADKYTPIIKVAKDPKYAPTVKLNISEKRDKEGNSLGGFTTDLVDAKRNKINDDADKVLVRNSTITALIDVGGLWISNVGYGLTLRLKSAMVHSSPNNSSSDFVEDDDEEAEYIPEPVAPIAGSLIASVLPTVAPIAAAAADEEEEEGEDEEEAPKPKPVIRRKTVPVKK